MPYFTFKKEPRPTGLARVIFEPYTHVKRDGVECGYIFQHDGTWRVRLQGMKRPGEQDENTNSPWRWFKLKAQHPTEEEARVWLNRNALAIVKAIGTLYLRE